MAYYAHVGVFTIARAAIMWCWRVVINGFQSSVTTARVPQSFRSGLGAGSRPVRGITGMSPAGADGTSSLDVGEEQPRRL